MPAASLPLATPVGCDPVLLDFALTTAGEFNGWGQVGDDGPRAVYAVIWAGNDQLDAVWIDAGRGLVLLTPAGRP